jgi:hypothetical protein
VPNTFPSTLHHNANQYPYFHTCIKYIVKEQIVSDMEAYKTIDVLPWNTLISLLCTSVADFVTKLTRMNRLGDLIRSSVVLP